MPTTCNTCNKTFLSLKNLEKHMKTAKYCLKLKGEEKNDFYCESCQKYFSSNRRLQTHLNICKEKLKEKNTIYEQKLKEKDTFYEKKLKEKDDYIKKLEEKLEKFENALINQKFTTNNTTNNIVVNNFLDLQNIEKIQNIIDMHMNGNVLCNGQKGLAKMIYEKFLKDDNGNLLYKCIDSSRQKFEYVGDNGNKEKDIKANKLKKALIDSNVCKKAHERSNELWTDQSGLINADKFNLLCDKVLEIVNFDKDDKKFRTELTKLTFL